MSLIMRRNLMAAKSGYTAKDYVQDGIVYLFDAIENVGFGLPQDKTKTTWHNLVRNDETLDGVFVGSPTWGDDYLSIRGWTNTVSIGLEEQDWGVSHTHEICISSFNAPGSTGAFLGRGRGIEIRNSSRGFVGWGLDNQFSESFRGRTTVSATITPTGNRGSINLYEAGSKFGMVTAISVSSGAYSYGFYIGRGSSNLRCINGYYHCIRIYNRPLSEDELKINYAIDKARFNLP